MAPVGAELGIRCNRLTAQQQWGVQLHGATYTGSCMDAASFRRQCYEDQLGPFKAKGRAVCEFELNSMNRSPRKVLALQASRLP